MIRETLVKSCQTPSRETSDLNRLHQNFQHFITQTTGAALGPNYFKTALDQSARVIVDLEQLATVTRITPCEKNTHIPDNIIVTFFEANQEQITYQTTVQPNYEYKPFLPIVQLYTLDHVLERQHTIDPISIRYTDYDHDSKDKTHTVVQEYEANMYDGFAALRYFENTNSHILNAEAVCKPGDGPTWIETSGSIQDKNQPYMPPKCFGDKLSDQMTQKLFDDGIVAPHWTRDIRENQIKYTTRYPILNTNWSIIFGFGSILPYKIMGEIRRFWPNFESPTDEQLLSPNEHYRYIDPFSGRLHEPFKPSFITMYPEESFYDNVI